MKIPLPYFHSHTRIDISAFQFNRRTNFLNWVWVIVRRWMKQNSFLPSAMNNEFPYLQNVRRKIQFIQICNLNSTFHSFNPSSERITHATNIAQNPSKNEPLKKTMKKQWKLKYLDHHWHQVATATWNAITFITSPNICLLARCNDIVSNTSIESCTFIRCSWSLY